MRSSAIDNIRTGVLPAGVACRTPCRPRGGWILAEAIVALWVLGLLLGGLVVTQNAARRFNKMQLVRMQCISACQAQLDSIVATGKPVDRTEFSRLWPGVSATIERSPGTGHWHGLTLVKVTAVGSANEREVKVDLARYVQEKNR